MIVDGKAIAKEILAAVKADIATMANVPRLTVFTCAPNFETQKFLDLKQKRALEVGIMVEVVSLDPSMPTVEVVRSIEEKLPHTDGVIVQLPFPPTIDIMGVLATIPRSHDVDTLWYDGTDTGVLPPVVGAIDAIAKQYQVVWTGRQVVVVGKGRLVGAPAALYAHSSGAQVTVLEKDTEGNTDKIKEADILILGAGVSGLVTGEMVKPGVIVFDAGTSEEGGMLVGDADASLIEVASIVTPVPGGIGPITIAVLLRNVVKLVQKQ
jgi:methylenetetrahydrofolate dehydrogenase (NADP+) / methenyltetrahydrofolate cyclohydrolase